MESREARRKQSAAFPPKVFAFQSAPCVQALRWESAKSWPDQFDHGLAFTLDGGVGGGGGGGGRPCSSAMDPCC